MILLDTSALIAHQKGEPGHALVAAAIDEGAWVAAPTWLELWIQLGPKPGSEHIVSLYHSLVVGTVDVTAAVAATAYAVRRETQGRLPAVDCMIAACAKAKGFRLIHRDKHMASIPQSLLHHTMLPAKA